MFPQGYEWLADAFPPRMVVSGLFLHQLPAEDWLRETCVDAGKLFVIQPDQDLPGGRIAVSDLSLVDEFDPAIHDERPRPDLSTGARRLKVGRAFDPAMVGRAVGQGVLGDIAIHGPDAGIVLGDDGAAVHVLLAGLTVAKWPIGETRFFHPPATNGSDFMARYELHEDGSLDREAMVWLLGEVEAEASA